MCPPPLARLGARDGCCSGWGGEHRQGHGCICLLPLRRRSPSESAAVCSSNSSAKMSEFAGNFSTQEETVSAGGLYRYDRQSSFLRPEKQRGEFDGATMPIELTSCVTLTMTHVDSAGAITAPLNDDSTTLPSSSVIRLVDFGLIPLQRSVSERSGPGRCHGH